MTSISRPRRGVHKFAFGVVAVATSVAVGNVADADQIAQQDRYEPSNTAGSNAGETDPAWLSALTPDPANSKSVTVDAIETIGLYIPVAPARVFDTRSNKDTLVEVPTRRMIPNEELRIDFTELPSVKSSDFLMAAAINITVTNADESGHVSAYPCGSPPATSSVNIQARKTFANAAIVSALSVASGEAEQADICFKSSIPLDLVVDFSGYFAQTEDPEAGSFGSLNPVRMFDTRTNADSVVSIASGKRSTGDVIEVNLQPWGDRPLPKAVEVRLTTVGSESPGYVVAYPCKGGPPNSSTVNLSTVHAMTNSAIVPVGDDYRICVKVVGTTHVVMDMSAYFTDADFGLHYLPLETPRRALDTRPGFASDLDASLPFANRTEVQVMLGELDYYEAKPRAVSANVTTVNARGRGYLRTWGPGSPEPKTSINNYQGGQQGRASTATLDLGTIDGRYGWTLFSTPEVTDVIIDINGYYFDTDDYPY